MKAPRRNSKGMRGAGGPLAVVERSRVMFGTIWSTYFDVLCNKDSYGFKLTHAVTDACRCYSSAYYKSARSGDGDEF